MTSNLKIQVDMGLQKDWGVFNLYGAGEGNAYTYINIEVITDGDSYVENTTASVAHAASSQYKELEAILPLVTHDDGTLGWDITKYGSKFKKMMTGYYPITVATQGGDLWSLASSYKDYVNQFNITFDGTLSSYSLTDKLQYYDYKANPQSYANHNYILKKFSELSGTEGIDANIDLIHFSKYYNIYAPSTIPIPTLKPLINDRDQLERFNILVDDNGKPHINNLLLMDIESERDKEGFQMKKVTYNGSGYNYEEDGETIDMWNELHHGMSMFKSCPQPDAVYPYIDRESIFYEFMPHGFSLLEIWDRHAMFRSDNKEYRDEAEKPLPSGYTSYFSLDSGLTNVQWGLDNVGVHKPLTTLVYFGDQQQNFRIFNNYFPVTKSGNVISDTISYSSTYASKKPPTISMALVSVLANIYIYNGEDERTNDITYISDCVFLTLNTTIYTKDMIYKAYVNDTSKLQLMLLFLKVPFSDYIAYVKAASQQDQSLASHTKRAKDLNVKPTINACIKNIPLQININYIEPDIEGVGLEGNQTRIYRIDGTHKDVHNWVPSVNILYLLNVDTKGNYIAKKLSKDFTIEYLKLGSLVFTDDILTAEYDTNMTSDVNQNIYDVLTYGEEGLEFKYTKAYGTISDYYSIGTHEDHGTSGDTYGTLKYIPKKDVLIPYARLMY